MKQLPLQSPNVLSPRSQSPSLSVQNQNVNDTVKLSSNDIDTQETGILES